MSLDAPVLGAAAFAVWSAPDDPVLGVFRHLSLDVPVRGAAPSDAWSAPDVPVRGVQSLRRCLASSPFRCCSSASSGPPPLWFSAGSWGFLGGVGAFWWALPVWLGVACHRLPCRGCVVVARAVRVRGTRLPLLLGTCLCAVVVASGVPLWCASWPRVGAPSHVRSGRSRCSSRLPRRRGAFPHPGGIRFGLTGRLRGARRGRPKTGLIVPVAGPRGDRGAEIAACRIHLGPRDGVVRGGSLQRRCWAPCAARGWRLWTQLLTRPVSRTGRLSRGDSVGALGLFHVDADTSFCGSEDATPGSRARVLVLVLPGRVGCAGLQGAFWCASPSLLAVVSSCFAWTPPGLGYPCLLVCLPPPVGPFFSVFPRPCFSLLSLGSGCGRPGPRRCLPPPPPSPLSLFFLLFVATLLWLVFVFCHPHFTLPSPAPCVFFCCLLRSVFASPCPPVPLPRGLPVSFVFLGPPLPSFCAGFLSFLLWLVFIFFSLSFPLHPPPSLYFFCLLVFPSVCPPFSSTPPPSPFLFAHFPSLFFCLPFWRCLLWLVIISGRLPIPFAPFSFFSPSCLFPLAPPLLCTPPRALFFCPPFLPCFFFLVFFFSPLVRPRSLWGSVFPGPGCLGPWCLVGPLPPSLCFCFPYPRPLFFFCFSFLLCFWRFCLLFLFFSASLFFLSRWSAGGGGGGAVLPPPLAGCGTLCYSSSWVVSCHAAVCGVFCVLPGAVWCGCVGLHSCALLSGAVLCWVLFCCFCRVAPSRAAVFSAVFFLRWSLPPRLAPGCFCLCSAPQWCVLLFGAALSCCGLVLAAFALCCLVLCRAVVRLLVLCCFVCFVAVLGPRLASSAAVAGRCAPSVLGRGAVSSCCAACGPAAVPSCAVFLGASPFVAPLVWCCVGWPLSLLSVRCPIAPLTLAGVVCCCLLRLGVCCWAWLSSVVSWWLLVSCFGGAVPAWPRGLPPRGLVRCVFLLRSPVLCSVVLCCPVVVCCRALLSVWVVAFACCLFPAAALSAVSVLVCFLVVVLSACCGALHPCVMSCGAALLCGAKLLSSGVFLRCCVCLLVHFSLITAAKALKKIYVFLIEYNYTQPNTPASNQTMYFVLTYMLPVVGGDALVFVGSYLRWSLARLLAFIARGLPLSPRAAA